MSFGAQHKIRKDRQLNSPCQCTITLLSLPDSKLDREKAGHFDPRPVIYCHVACLKDGVLNNKYYIHTSIFIFHNVQILAVSLLTMIMLWRVI